LRERFIDYIRKVAADIRTFLLPAVYGLCGGLAAVAFQSALSFVFSTLWEVPSQQMTPGTFAVISLLTIVVTSISASLILIFEMTHQFSLVPLLMIGTVASQAVSRTLCRADFYNGIIEQDGVELDRYLGSPSVASLQSRAISTPE